MRNEFMELEEARLLEIDRPKRRLRDELAPYIPIAKIVIVAAILLMGIHVVNQLDEVMSQQAIQDKTISDAMDQLMWLRMEIDELQEVDEPDPPKQISLGEYTITHYCACPECCGKWADGITATGTEATEGRTIAVDPEVIPYGTKVLIDGHTYIAEDNGGAIKGQKIDVFVSDHQTAINRGRITREVHIYDK